MNWKLIFQLSVFGMIMACATVSLIPSSVEPVFWLVIFIFCSYTIAKACYSKFFLYGFFTGLLNCVWVTAVHLFFFSSYTAHHQDVLKMASNMPGPLIVHPRMSVAIAGLFMGFLSTLVFGAFALVASKFVKKPIESV